jgi:hypothetical protein
MYQDTIDKFDTWQECFDRLVEWQTKGVKR